MYKLEITGGGVDKVFQLVSDALDPRIILTAIGARFTSYIDESFRTSGRGQWKPLSALTLMMRGRGGTMPLQNTGRYKMSYVTETDNKTFIEVGSNLKTPDGKYVLGRIHEYGTGPYIIRAKTAKVLAAASNAVTANGKMSGYIFFGKVVHHPGIPARPVLPTAVIADKLAQETIDALLSRTIASKGG